LPLLVPDGLPAVTVLAGSDVHEFGPPVHDAVGLREEAMFDDVRTWPLWRMVQEMPPADALGGFEDDSVDAGVAERLNRGGETGWAGADGDSGL
jgi:hypothetical protein